MNAIEIVPAKQTTIAQLKAHNNKQRDELLVALRELASIQAKHEIILHLVRDAFREGAAIRGGKLSINERLEEFLKLNGLK